MTDQTQPQAEYLRTVAELTELAQNAPYVDPPWILSVASMDPAEMRRRLIRSYDWSGHFHHSLDGIEAIQSMPGSGIDGCRSHKEVRAVVLGLLDKIQCLEAAKSTPEGYGQAAERLHTFVDAAAGEGLVLGGIDAGDLYVALFPERYAAAAAKDKP